MKRQYWILAGLFAAGAFVGVAVSQVIYAQVVSSPTRQILGTDLQGIPGQEILFFTTDWAPGQKLPWHIHPDGHEFAYLIEGELTFEIEGIGKKGCQSRRAWPRPAWRRSLRAERKRKAGTNARD